MPHLILSVKHAEASALSAAFVTWRWSLIAYVVFTGLWFIILQRSRNHGRLSWREVGKFIFPRELWIDRTAKISHFHFLLSLILWTPLVSAATVFLVGDLNVDVHNHLTNLLGARPPAIHAVWAVVAVQVIFIDLATGLSGWLIHYAFHRVPLLWSFHRAHHSAEALTLPALARDHPLETLIVYFWVIISAGVAGGFFLYLTGTEMNKVTLALLANVYFWKHFVGQFNHSHIPISFGWLNRIFQGPVLHQIHHSAERRHRDKNMGSTGLIAIWDWLFGTLHMPERKREPLTFGIAIGARAHHTAMGCLVAPFVHAWGRLRPPDASVRHETAV